MVHPRLRHARRPVGEEVFLAQAEDADALRRLALCPSQTVWCCEPREISFFHVLFCVASASGVDQLTEPSDARFTAGIDALCPRTGRDVADAPQDTGTDGAAHS